MINIIIDCVQEGPHLRAVGAAGPVPESLQPPLQLELADLALLRPVVALRRRGGLLLALRGLQLFAEGEVRGPVLALLEELLPHLRAGLVHDVDGLVLCLYMIHIRACT